VAVPVSSWRFGPTVQLQRNRLLRQKEQFMQCHLFSGAQIEHPADETTKNAEQPMLVETEAEVGTLARTLTGV